MSFIKPDLVVELRGGGVLFEGLGALFAFVVLA